MKKICCLALLVTAFSSPSTSAEQLQIEVISLQHRTTEDVIPVIRPLIPAGGTITGMNNQLIVKSTPANLDEIRHLLQSIDRAQRRLVIYVKQDTDSQLSGRDNSLTGNYGSDELSISNAEIKPSGEGLVIAGKDDDGNDFRYREFSAHAQLEDKNTFHVQTLEGQAAFIQSGLSVPINRQNTYLTHGTVIIQDTTEYHDVTSGFYVLPRLSGDIVTLLISPQLSHTQSAHAPVFDIQNVQTTVSGRLGEWLNIGGVDRNFDQDKHEILQGSLTTGQESRNILIMVEEVR